MISSRRLRLWLTSLLLVAAPLRTAEAHARLVRSAPAAGSQVTASSALSLTFSEALTVGLCRVTLRDAANTAVSVGAVAADPRDPRTLSVPIRGALGPGHYVVQWQVAGDDGHPSRGQFAFDVVAAGKGSAARPDGQPLLLGGATFAFPGLLLVRDRLVQASGESAFGVESPAYVVVRALQSMALVVLLGVLCFHFVIAPRVARGLTPPANDAMHGMERMTVRWATTALAILLLVTVARLVAQHLAVFGSDEAPSMASWQALLSTSMWARGWWLALGATGVGLWTTRLLRRPVPAGWPLLAAAALGIASSLALSGHAAASSVVGVAIHVLHVLGAGGWIGSLAVLTLVALPLVVRTSHEQRQPLIADLVRAFSPVALVCAGLLGVTGLLAAWRNLGSMSALWQARYGQVLLVKLALLSITAATGFFNWRYVLPAFGTDSATARLRRSATIELTAALLVLIVTAVLVATPMPAEMIDTRQR